MNSLLLRQYHYRFIRCLLIKFYFRLFSGLRILGFPCNQFAGQMPENDGDDMVCHLQKENASFGDVFAKVTEISL